MGRFERVVSEDGLPYRRVVLPRDDGTERELWVPDVSSPEVKAAIQADVERLNASEADKEDIAKVLAAQSETWARLDESE